MKQLLSSKTLYAQTYHALEPAHLPAHERQAVAQRLLGHYFQLTLADLVVDRVVPAPRAQQQQLATASKRLCQQEPLQYVLGQAPFLGHDFQVSPAVLIPRPETEAWVQHLIDLQLPPGRRVLDIGTGSGCIAITLQLALPQATVLALDNSPAALQVAQANAHRLGASVHFLLKDVLHTPFPEQIWDIIVSNPPYVCQAEQIHMQPQVLHHEPAGALFVPDERPLIFHEKIVAQAGQHLAPGGTLCLEINEAFGPAVAQLLRQAGLQAVHIGQDLQGKDRWVMGCQPD